MTPWLILLAGPNGSGKSTLARQPEFSAKMSHETVVVINPDEIAKRAPLATNPLIWSGREIRRQIEALTRSRKSLIIETTLSGNNHFRTVEDCKLLGYKIALHFVFVSDLKLANLRVKLRVSQGGHDVSEKDQARRYERSFNNATRMITLCDEAFIYNNDGQFGHLRVATYHHGTAILKALDLRWLP